MHSDSILFVSSGESSIASVSPLFIGPKVDTITLNQNVPVNPRRTQVQVPAQVNLIRPQSGTVVSAGERINGVGWIDSDKPVSEIQIVMGRKRLGKARVGIPPAELAMLIEQPPPRSATNFVFCVVVPLLAAGPATLRLQIKAEAGRQQHNLRMTVAAAATPGNLESVRAMVETAEIDAQGVLRVVGWAVSLAPLEKLQVFLGERLIGLAEHGAPRDDVVATLPAYPNARRAGFFFRAALVGPDPDEVTVRVVCVTADGTRRAISAPLTRKEPQQRDATQGFAELDIERVRLSKDGVFALSGWAVASAGVEELLVELNGTLVATALPNEERADVAKLFRQLPGALRSGFRVVRRLPPPAGESAQVRVTVRGRNGAEHVGQRSVTIAARAWP